MTSCDRCAQIRGTACHCAACHETFATLTLFDDHQVTNYTKRPAVRCRNPRRMGLVLDAWGTWRTPENLQATTNRVSAMNTARYERRTNGE